MNITSIYVSREFLAALLNWFVADTHKCLLIQFSVILSKFYKLCSVIMQSFGFASVCHQ